MPFPRLAFGENAALRITGERQIQDHLSALQRPLSAFGYRSGSGEARTAIRSVRVDGLFLMATASDAYYLKTETDLSSSLRIPLFGAGEVRQGKRAVRWKAGRIAVVSSYEEPQQLTSERNSILILHYRRNALVRVAKAMYGRENIQEQHLWPETPRLVSTVRGAVDYAQLLMSAATLAEASATDPEHLARIGVSDVVSRLIVAQLMEGTAAADGDLEGGRKPRKEAALDLLCERIVSQVGKPMTSTEMEELSGVSGRALRYAFQSRFGCSPQEWQRNVYLDHARGSLSADDGPIVIKALAHDLGFSSAQSFAAFYKRRFGELPNETLATKKRKP